MGNRFWRRTVAIASGLVIVAGFGVTGAYFYLRGSLPEYDRDAPLAGLESDAVVWFDRWAIPTVVAGSEADLFRAQGWVHAGDRLWQMEMYQRVAQGRLAELFGVRALPADRLTRTLDLWGAAATSLAALPERERVLLEAYAAGVNARLDAWEGPWPPEFLLLRFEPQRWSPQASLAIAKIMALDLSGWRTELSRIRARARLPAGLAETLEPRYPAWGPTIVQDGPGDRRGAEVPPGDQETRWIGRTPQAPPPGTDAGPDEPTGASAAGRAVDRAPTRADREERDEAWAPLEFLASFGLGASNSWAVSGDRARDSVPLLANDMHLSLRAPSTWYLNSLHADSSDLRVAGLTIPGLPGVVVGFNRHLAWGFTNGMVDDADFVVESPNLDQSAYREGDAWVPFDARREVIAVRRAAADTLVIRRTPRGPVVTDVLDGGGLTLSLVWAGHRGTTETVGLLGMNRSTDAAEFLRAVGRFTSPHQNVIYATLDGEIGYRLSGSVPRRSAAAVDAISFERFGTGWAGFRSPRDLPELRSPASDFLASANNLQSWTEFGEIGVDYPLPFRARRIVDLLSARRDWTAPEMLDVQRDTRSAWAGRWIRRAAAAARRVGDSEAATTLEEWDLFISVDSRAATLFHVWLYRLRQRIAGDQAGGVGYFPDWTLSEVLETADSSWVDDVRTPGIETLESLEEEAMRTAIEEAAGRTWGRVHLERSVHLLGSLSWLDRWLGLNVGPYPAPGGPHTVRPDGHPHWSSLDSASWRLPMTSEYGPSERFVARLGPDEVQGWFLLPTGQSGNPFSEHYRDMARRWTGGELIPVFLDPAVARSAARSRTRLRVPAGEATDPE